MSSKNLDKSPGPPGDPEEASSANDAATGVSAPAIVVTPPPSPRLLSSEEVPEQEPIVPAATGTLPRSDPPQSTPVQVLAISDMALDCWELFRHLLERMDSRAPITQRLVTEYQQRYDSWIGFLGVFAQENLNLDHRLRNSPEVKSLVTQQLHIAKKNLNAAVELVGMKEAVTGRLTHLAEEEDVPQLSPALKATLAGIEGALDRLHRLGTSIRGASAGQLMSRIKAFSSDERLKSLEILAYYVLETLYPAANPKLLEHICKSLAEKYQKVLYLGARKAQYGQAPTVRRGLHSWRPRDRNSRSARKVEGGDSRGAEGSLGDSDPEGYKPSPSQPGHVVLPSVRSSTFNEGEFKRSYKPTLPPTDPHRRPTASISTNLAVYTPLQALPDNAKYGDCTWCFKNYPAEMFNAPEKWRAHQKEDWKPYVCLSGDCAQQAARANKPIPSFERSLDWQKHMEEHSVEWSREIYKPTTWVCGVDVDPETGQRRTSRFSSEADFLEHLEREHPKYTPQRRLRMARHSTVFLSRDANTCPLCCFSVDEDERPSGPETVGSSAPPGSSSVKKALEEIAEEEEEGGDGPEVSDEALQSCRRMARHVSDHLHTFTFLVIRLLSLPQRVDSDDEDGQNTVSTDPGGDETSEVADSDYQDLFVKEDETHTPAQGADDYFPARDESKDDFNRLLEAGKIDLAAKDDRYGRTPLCWASAHGYEDVVENLLDMGADIEAADNDGLTPLFLAADTGQTAVVETLLRKGALVDAGDEDGPTPLFLAVRSKHTAIVELLIKWGANLEAKDADGWTPLFLATATERAANVELLIESGANVNVVVPVMKDAGDGCFNIEFGMTPLLWAARNGYEAVMRCLLKGGADLAVMTSSRETPLLLAARGGHTLAVRLLLDAGADATVQDIAGRTALALAASGSHYSVAKLLIEHGVDVMARDTGGRTALHLAATINYVVVVLLLLDAGARVDEQAGPGVEEIDAKHMSNVELNYGSFYSAVSGGDAKMEFERLDLNGGSLHIEARGAGARLEIACLVMNGGSFYAVADGGGAEVDIGRLHVNGGLFHLRTPHLRIRRLVMNDGSLNAVVEGGSAEFQVENILMTGGSFRSEVSGGGAELKIGRLDIHGGSFCSKTSGGASRVEVETLEINGAPVGQTETTTARRADEEKQKALVDRYLGRSPRRAVLNGTIQMKDAMVLAEDASLDTGGGLTPLHLAAQNGNEAVVELLLDYGADINARWGQLTAIGLASQSFHDRVVKLLLKRWTLLDDGELYEYDPATA